MNDTDRDTAKAKAKASAQSPKTLALADIQAAAARIGDYIHRTPVLTSQAINEELGASVYFKCENLQRSGAFKFRGACNAVLSLTADERKAGVATHSSGNHGAALALAAKENSTHCVVVMPSNANAAKKAAARRYGAEIIECEPTQASREEALQQLIAERALVPIPPFNDQRIIAGQGTAALELLDQAGPLDTVVAPVGGGGLLSGTALAVALYAQATRTLGAEPLAADDAYQSFVAGRIIEQDTPDTIADGLRTNLGTLTFPLIKQHVERIITVSEEDIVHAMRVIWERMKIIVEPSAAVALAACLNAPAEINGKRVGIILSGGNVDLDHLPWP